MNLTSNSASDTSPAWSPDSKKLAFTRDDGSFNLEIWAMNADGSAQTNLTSNSALDTGAAWSPDGQRIAFTTTRDGNSEIYVMNADGSAQTNLTNDAATDSGADWSPDGKKIAFTSRRDGNAEIYVMNADGSNPTRITDTSASDFSPVWSPDGQKIAFRSNRDGNGYEIYVMNANGTGQTRLTNNTFLDIDPDWQPVNPAPYPRPVGASPLRLSLVPAFVPCDSATANATHQAPLSGASCNPPVPRSSLVAVGPRSLGFARMIVLGSGECAPFDSTHCYPDVTIRFNITDVRSGSPTGPDYGTPSSEDLTGIATLPGSAQGSTTQITDQNNKSLGDPSGPYDKSATVVPLRFPVPIDCVPVLNPTDGSVCNAQTTANTLVPGSAAARKRAIWELGQVEVLDQGADGVPGNGDDQVFEAQGVFVP